MGGGFAPRGQIIATDPVMANADYEAW